jgi:hypothetical protein
VLNRETQAAASSQKSEQRAQKVVKQKAKKSNFFGDGTIFLSKSNGQSRPKLLVEVQTSADVVSKRLDCSCLLSKEVCCLCAFCALCFPFHNLQEIL